ncbi:MAG: S-adenosylmethionine:tRNA ribosyltransferase-isomerase [Candidatus Delongbacteria bacterium]|jgi:S-adenosylmethionine:tRNA ribosyltransferase-isomerase|nr:S-adenosylmethionine:tRNA ribosyltransferase-isomerase [Candidatus Delongbacteria bacterium]
MTNDTKLIKIADYTYTLPESRIAKYPLEARDTSKLLIYNRGTLKQNKFHKLTGYLPADGLMVWNDSRVLNARLVFHKSTGARIEIFCISPAGEQDYSTALQSKGKTTWKCIIGNLKKWKTGALTGIFNIDDKEIKIHAKLIERGKTEHVVEFCWDYTGTSFADIMEHSGLTPIPPYLNRESEPIDRQRYQTVYSTVSGSVAAPTAGLHFSDRMLQTLRQSNTETASLTLHVGTGTFQPVKSKHIGDHIMHTEFFYASRDLLMLLKKHAGNITAVGTTSLRGMESLLQAGIKAMQGETQLDAPQHISQWEAYNRPEGISLETVLDFMIEESDRLNIHHIHGKTSMMIAPGYPFLLPDRLITNFHQPGSTLLLLIAAYIGDDWKKVYDYALLHGFRFLSYGDSTLLQNS